MELDGAKLKGINQCTHTKGGGTSRSDKKKVRCSSLGSTKTSRFHLALELRFRKKLHETSFYVNQQLFWCIFCSEAMGKSEPVFQG